MVRFSELVRVNTSSNGLNQVALVDDSQHIGMRRGALNIDVVSDLAVAGNGCRFAQEHSGNLGVRLDEDTNRGQGHAVLRGAKLVHHCQAASEQRARDKRTGARRRARAAQCLAEVRVNGPRPVLGRAAQTSGNRGDGLVGGVAEVGSAIEDGFEPVDCDGDAVHLGEVRSG